MRLISLHEPWATLIALQFKRVESRDWETRYRGPLAIHASKHGMSLQDTQDICSNPIFWNALQAYQPFRDSTRSHNPDTVSKKAMISAFPNRGKIVAIVDLVGCWRADTFETRYPGSMTTAERAFGNYESIDFDTKRPRFGWMTKHIFTVTEPVPFVSRQGLVDVPNEIRIELLRQFYATQKKEDTGHAT